jgi:hypothetical protein
MSDKKTPKLLMESLIGTFRRAAIVYHYGALDEDNAIARAGGRAVHRAVKTIEECAYEGRLALVPLLEDPDPCVRVFAAGFLTRVMPERTVPILREIKDSWEIMQCRTASDILWKHEKGELNM